MKNNKLIYIIMAIIIILIVVIVGLAIGIPFMKDNAEDNSSSSNESSSSTEEKEGNDEDTENIEESKIMFEWIGKYTDDDITVVISPISSDTLEMSVSKNSSNGGFHRNVNIYEMTEDELLGKKYYDSDEEINIEKNKDGISIECKKLEDDDFDFSGDYEKEDLDSTDWTGIYQKDDITIILSKTNEDVIDYIIEKNSKRGAKSTSSTIKHESEKKLEKEDEDFSDEYTIKFEKKGDSIVVKATSEDEDSLLNEIDGTYTKIQ